MTKEQKCKQKPYYGSLDNFMKNKKNIESEIKILELKENFLPWEFDFKLEYRNFGKTENKFWNLDEEGNYIKRFFKYKIDNNSFECDGIGNGAEKYLCKLSREIYRKLWDWNDEYEDAQIRLKCEKKVKQYGVCPSLGYKISGHTLDFGPDTMNSFVTVFNRFNRLVENGLYSEQNKKIVWDKLKEINKSTRRGSALYYYTLLVDGEDENKPWENITQDDREMWNQYARYTHTLGNFVLVPKYFNNYRKSIVSDYWVSSLCLLKDKDDNKMWTTRWGNVKWKKEFYSKYINTFFLWEYVDSENISLSEFPDNTLIEARRFVERTIKLIKRRGCFMVAMLRIALGINLDGKVETLKYTYNGKDGDWTDWKVSGIYKKLMDNVFMTDKVYSGYLGKEGVIENIRNLLEDEDIGNPDEEFANDILNELVKQLDEINKESECDKV